MNYRNFILTILFSLTTLVLWGQERIPVDLKNNQLNLNLFTPGVSFEQRVGPNQSLNLGLGIIGLVDSDGSSINPLVRGSFRNYYPRKQVQKELNPNSGNYIALDAGYYFNSVTNETTQLSDSFFMGAVWGIHFGLSLGPGFVVGSDSDYRFTGIGQIQLGFVLK